MTSGIGAPPIGVALWHDLQLLASVFDTPQGNTALATGAPSGAAGVAPGNPAPAAGVLGVAAGVLPGAALPTGAGVEGAEVLGRVEPGALVAPAPAAPGKTAGGLLGAAADGCGLCAGSEPQAASKHNHALAAWSRSVAGLRGAAGSGGS
ncbi:MAG: hypothetical protein ABW321_35285 [Polyangiales bacterium]